MTPLLLLPLILAAQQEARVPKHLDLFVGAEVVLEARPTKAKMGDAKIADLKVVGDDQLLVVGMSEGETLLKVWLKGRLDPDEITVRVTRKPAAPNPGEEKLTLKIGTEHVLTIPGVMRIAIGDADLCDVKTIGNDQIKLIPRKAEGDTTMLVWTTGGVRKSWLLHVTY